MIQGCIRRMQKLTQRIVLLGPPGCGKGTQAKRLSKFYKISHISTGDILRKSLQRNDSISNKVKNYMNKGELVPDEIIFSIIKRRLKKRDASKGFVLDGFPRSIKQARELENLLRDVKIVVLNLKAKTPTIIRRLSGRRVCPNCGANYHIKFQPPKIDEKCDKCGVKLYQRNDDKPKAIRNRLRVYKKESNSLLKYYQKKGLLKSINGEGDEIKIFDEIKSLIDLRNDTLKVRTGNYRN